MDRQLLLKLLLSLYKQNHESTVRLCSDDKCKEQNKPRTLGLQPLSEFTGAVRWPGRRVRRPGAGPAVSESVSASVGAAAEPRRGKCFAAAEEKWPGG